MGMVDDRQSQELFETSELLQSIIVVLVEGFAAA
jgi:hypothetical protein